MTESLGILLLELVIMLSPFLIIGLIIYAVMRKNNTRTKKPRLLGESFNQDMRGMSLLIIMFLFFALMGIAQRLLWDIAKHASGQTRLDPSEYFSNLEVIGVHALIIIPLLIVSIVIVVMLGQKLKQYAVVFLPYLLTTIILTLQLLLQVTVYFIDNHTKVQYYIVIPLVILITSAAIYWIQHLYQNKLEEMRREQNA